MRTIGAALLATTMIVSSAFAADSVGPLTPGKPAGVQKAQAGDTTLLWLIGAGLVVGGIILVASNNGGNSTPSGTTSGGSTGGGGTTTTTTATTP
jgi:hypothetical protein